MNRNDPDLNLDLKMKTVCGFYGFTMSLGSDHGFTNPNLSFSQQHVPFDKYSLSPSKDWL